MAEIDVETAPPEQLIREGTRAYIIHDYNNAIQMLSKAIEKVTAEKDEKDDFLGEAYLYYGKSLLEYSREEDDPLGDAVPREIKTGESEDTDDDDDGEGEDGAEPEEEEAAEKDKKVDDEKQSDSGKAAVDEKTAESTETVGEKPAEAEPMETIKEEDEKKSKEETESKTESADKKANGTESVEKAVASSSTGKDEEKSEDITTEEEDDNPSDLQLAWEVLELAKIIFKNRGANGEKLLADTLVSLGEVAMESENFASAISDIKDGIEIQERVGEKHSRRLSESFYKLGIAYAANNQLDEAIQYFEKSHSILTDRLLLLEKEPVENRDELKELKSLIPEIQEKINDTKNFKVELAKQKEATTNENGNDTGNVSGSDKAINDISHLVKRKRPLAAINEEEKPDENPAKRPSP